MGIIVGAIFLGPGAVSVLAVVFATMASCEFIKLTGGWMRSRAVTNALDVVGAAILPLACYDRMLYIWMAVMIVRLIAELYTHDARPLRHLGQSALTQLYIGVPLLFMDIIATSPSTPMLLLAIFVLIWINDTGAFVVGCTFGKHRLFERISPKKSWEGFFGGLGFVLVASAIFATYCPGFFHLEGMAKWLGLGLIVTLFGTWGDLIESMIKRNLQVKDSGNVIPGHGGILDRIDSLLLVLPSVSIYLLLLSEI